MTWLCCQRDWGKHASDIDCGRPLGCLWYKLPPVQIEVLASLAWQHLAAAWLRSRYYNLLLVSTLNQIFTVAIWNCYRVSESCWSLQGFPADQSAYIWESGGLGWCDQDHLYNIGMRWLTPHLWVLPLLPPQSAATSPPPLVLWPCFGSVFFLLLTLRRGSFIPY